MARRAATPRIGLKGGPELARALARLDKAVADETVKAATLAAAEVLAAEWRSRVPVDDANYKTSIKARARAGKRGATGTVGTLTVPGVPRSQQPRNYAPRLEFGGKGMAAQPSLRPAFDAAKEQMIDVMTSELQRLIARAT